jgi:hypothetical protein
MREVKVCCAVIGSLLAIGGLSFANSFSDNSHYVSLGQRNGYYVLRPGSRLSHQLGLDDAPYLDTADPFRHGYGADVLAFRFNQRGVLSMPPGLHRTGISERFLYPSNWIAGSRPYDDEECGGAFWSRTQYCEATRRFHLLLCAACLQPLRKFRWRTALNWTR